MDSIYKHCYSFPLSSLALANAKYFARYHFHLCSTPLHTCFRSYKCLSLICSDHTTNILDTQKQNEQSAAIENQLSIMELPSPDKAPHLTNLKKSNTSSEVKKQCNVDAKHDTYPIGSSQCKLEEVEQKNIEKESVRTKSIGIQCSLITQKESSPPSTSTERNTIKVKHHALSSDGGFLISGERFHHPRSPSRDSKRSVRRYTADCFPNTQVGC